MHLRGGNDENGEGESWDIRGCHHMYVGNVVRSSEEFEGIEVNFYVLLFLIIIPSLVKATNLRERVNSTLGVLGRRSALHSTLIIVELILYFDMHQKTSGQWEWGNAILFLLNTPPTSGRQTQVLPFIHTAFFFRPRG